MTDPLRAHLARALDWDEAHAGFDKAVDGLPTALRGRKVPGFEHSPWQLVEHLRIAQADLLDFCVNPKYAHTRAWPEGYWPPAAAPPDEDAWDRSVAAFRQDRRALQEFVLGGSADLLAPVPTGTAKQTVLRAILLTLDHNAYHLGQLVAVRRALGAWG